MGGTEGWWVFGCTRIKGEGLAGAEGALLPSTDRTGRCPCGVGVVDRDEGFVDRTELCVARLAVQVHGDTVPVRMSNLAECDVTVCKDTHVGDFEQIFIYG